MSDIPLETEKKEPTDVLGAIQELTKAVTELAEHVSKLKEEWEKWRKAGKFVWVGALLCLCARAVVA